MLPYLPSGVSDQRTADGNGHFLPGDRKTYAGSRPFPVQADRVSAPGNLIAAAGVRRGRSVVGRAAGRCAGVCNNAGHVEIILEKNLGVIRSIVGLSC